MSIFVNLGAFVSWWQKKTITKYAYSTVFCLALSACGRNNQVTPMIAGSSVVTHEGITYHDQQPFTGKTFQLNQSGDTVSLIIYENGKMSGNDLAWYSTGIKKHERYYAQGRKEGVHMGWWPNGHIKFRYEFAADEYEGSVKEWYEDGTLFKSFTYEKGYENGPQKMWRIDGSVYANYVVKNNRIYGLSGRKNCKSLWKV